MAIECNSGLGANVRYYWEEDDNDRGRGNRIRDYIARIFSFPIGFLEGLMGDVCDGAYEFERRRGAIS